MLETVTLVLERAGRPLRARDIHAAASELADAPLRWRSVTGILSASTIGGDRRFRRVHHGVYELARGADEAGDGGARELRLLRGHQAEPLPK